MTAKATTIARSCCGTPLGERHDYNLVRDSIFAAAEARAEALWGTRRELEAEMVARNQFQ